MKTKIKYFMFIISVFFCFSCEKELTDLNIDNKHAIQADPSTLFAYATKSFADNISALSYTTQNPGVTRLWVQHLTSVTYLEGDRYLPAFSWNTLYTDVLSNLNETSTTLSEKLSDPQESEGEIKNQLAITEIMTVYAYTVLVDSYGNVPYSEAMDFENASPKFDDAQTIYQDLLERLSTAISDLDINFNGFESNQDLVYNGDVAKWIKFGNSLKLRMGIRIMDALPELGIKAVSESSKNVMQSNDDNALFRYLSDYPNVNTWWNLRVRQNLKYYVGTNVFIDKLNELEDPRRPVYFSPMDDGSYKGAIYGITQDYPKYSHESEYFLQPELPVIFIDLAQVEFLLAEAAERNIPGFTNAEDHYNKAIKASMAYYEVSENEIDDYLNQSTVKYSTAQGTWKEKIGIQKWIALYDQSLEAWAEYRRLDYPTLEAPPGADSDIVPLRFLYPIREQTLNGENYNEAASAMGGDKYSTPIFWDVE